MEDTETPSQTDQTISSDAPSPKRAQSKTSIRLPAAVLAAIVVAGAGAWFFMYGPGANHNTIASQLDPIKLRTDYTLYYPAELPSGYAFIEDSVRLEADTVRYTLRSGTEDIIINQQPTPREQLKFESLPGFRPLTVPAGQAYTGQAGGKPVVIITSTQTLISISAASAGTTIPEDMSQIAKALVPIKE